VRQLLAPKKQQGQSELSSALDDAMADFGTISDNSFLLHEKG
jgi:hypothetical protein